MERWVLSILWKYINSGSIALSTFTVYLDPYYSPAITSRVDQNIDLVAQLGLESNLC